MALDYKARYPAQTDADAGYPQGKARDIAAAGDGTGTPWQKDLVNDYWGLIQSLLSRFGKSPSGAPDQVGASQYFDAIEQLAKGQAAEAAWASMKEIDPGAFGTGPMGVVYAGPASGFNGRIIVGDPNGTPKKYKLSTDANAWADNTTNATNNGPFRLAYDPGGDVVVACGGSATQMQSSADKGDVWVNEAGAMASCDRVLFNGNAFVGWGVLDANNAQTSPNGKAPWTIRNDTGRFADAEEGDFNSVDVVARVLIARINTLAKSDDDGSSWSDVAMALAPVKQFNGIAYLNYEGGDVWIAVSDDEGIARSTDNGDTFAWIQVAGATGIDYKFVKHHADGRLMIVGRDTVTNRSFVRFSIDGGLTWGSRIDITEQLINDVGVVPGGFVLAPNQADLIIVTGRVPG